MRELGRIVRLQVQERSLKVGPVQRRAYDPFAIVSVPALTLGERGVTGVNASGDLHADVHHLDHPASKSREGSNGISVLFTGHYTAMRERFGAHLTDGVAGENILVDTDGIVDDDTVHHGLSIRTADGHDVHLHEVIVAEPCVEFTHFAIHYPAGARSDRKATGALSFLRAGMRGFYARYSGEPVTVRLGDTVLTSTG